MSLIQAHAEHKTIIGMVHLPPLPGTPFHRAGTFTKIVETAVSSARALDEAGADGCLVQTVDRVYPVIDDADPARVAALAILVHEIDAATSTAFRIGVQVMCNANQAALAVASVGGGTFIRATALVGASMTPHGLVQSDAEAVMRYRSAIGAREVDIVADIDTMHFRWFGGEKPIGEIARAARLVGASAVALSNPDMRAVIGAVEAVRAATPDMPVMLAGGTNHDNVDQLLRVADGAFVGSCLERSGWGGSIDPELARSYVNAVRQLGR